MKNIKKANKPSFFKKLGPISSNLIKSSINCKVVNVTKDDYFDSFVSIGKVTNNALSFLYDNEKLGDDLPLNSGIICSEKTANKLNPDQKKFIVRNVQESVAKISNIFYRDYTEKEKMNFDDPVFGENCEIGNNVTIGGQAGFAGHLKIGDNVVVAAKSGVTKNISNNKIVAGFPAKDIKLWKKEIIRNSLRK